MTNQNAPGVDIDALTKRLTARQEELKFLSQTASQSRAPVMLDQQSIGRLSRQDALQQQAMAKAQDARRQSEIIRIKEALKRVDEGEFGWCTECGDAISPKRLEIDPLVLACIQCAQ